MMLARRSVAAATTASGRPIPSEAVRSTP